MRRRLLFPALVLTAISLAVAPASALAEETTAETPTAESPHPSTGWVPQEGAPEGSGGGSSGAQQGSSLGSGGSGGGSTSKPAPAPPPTPSPEPAPPSSYEPEASAEPAPREPEPVVTPAPDPEPAPPKPDPEPSPPVDAHVSLGSADAVLEGSGEVKGVSASSADAEPVAAQVAPDAGGGLPSLALFVFSLILVVAGMLLVLGPFEADSLRYSRFKFLRRAAPRP